MSLETLIVKAIKNPSLAFWRLGQKVNNGIEDLMGTIFSQNNSEQIINQKEIRIAGMRRTGNHAIINWIKEQEKGQVLHLNNLVPNENPYRYKYQNLNSHFPQYQWSIEQFKTQAKGNLTYKDCLIYSYEDFALKEIFSQSFEKKHDLYVGKTTIRYDLLIIRDPFNLLASRLKNNYLPVKSLGKTAIALWIDYAKEYLGETNFLKHNKVCINYNLWVTERDYRQEVAHKLGIEFTDAGINKVLSHGGGSSFDGKKLDGEASKMDLNNRWQNFANDPVYRKLLDNEELLDYSQKIFGVIPGTEILKK
jgi:hypothetical protein